MTQTSHYRLTAAALALGPGLGVHRLARIQGGLSGQCLVPKRMCETTASKTSPTGFGQLEAFKAEKA